MSDTSLQFSLLSMFFLAASTWCCWGKERQRRYVRYFSSILFAFDVLPGSVHLMLPVEGAAKTACPITLITSHCFRCSTWQRPPGAAAAGGRSDKDGMTDISFLFDSLCFRCPTWQRPPGAAAAGGRSDIWPRIPRRIPPGPTSRGQWSTPLFAPPPGHVKNQLAFVDYEKNVLRERNISVFTSVGDLDPDVFGPPGSGSGSISQRYGSGSVIRC
jgi:hypothetical protein